MSTPRHRESGRSAGRSPDGSGDRSARRHRPAGQAPEYGQGYEGQPRTPRYRARPQWDDEERVAGRPANEDPRHFPEDAPRRRPTGHTGARPAPSPAAAAAGQGRRAPREGASRAGVPPRRSGAVPRGARPEGQRLPQGGYDDPRTGGAAVPPPRRTHAHEQAPAPKGRARAQKPRKKTDAGRRRALILGFVTIIALVFVGGAYLMSRSSGGEDYSGNGEGSVVVRLGEGEGAASLAGELAERGVVKSDSAFISAASSHSDMNTLQPGYYQLREKMSAEAAVARLLDPSARVGLLDVAGGATLDDVKVVGGQTVPGIYSLLSKASCLDMDGEEKCTDAEDYRAVVRDTDPAELGVPEWALEAVRSASDASRRIEGLIIAGVHHFDPTSDPKDIIRGLIEESSQRYEETGLLDSGKATGLSPYEVLVGASLVEKEAFRPEDFAKVARVITNRLAKPMRLQFDSTVNYGLNDQEVATTDEDRLRETPWNTYAKDGLPATPIAAPSEQALQGMEHPAEGAWLFFVTVDKEGTTEFNDTQEGHDQSVQKSIANGVLDSQR